MDNWVDFRAVKEAVSMEAVVNHYGIQLKRVNATSLRGRCPLPAHASKDSKASFGVETAKNVWACQSESCIAARGGSKGGNVLDFVTAMENCTVRDAALKLAEWFGIPGGPPPEAGATAHAPPPPAPAPRKTEPELVAERETVSPALPQARNKPLGFALKGVVYSDYLQQRGFSEEICAAYGVGLFPGKGSMAGRIVFPLRQQSQLGGTFELVGYAGRAVAPGVEPRWKVPEGLVKDFLYGYDRCDRNLGKTLHLVESFWGVLAFARAGIPNVGALMGMSLTDGKAAIAATWPGVKIILDGNDGARAAAEKIALKLMRKTFVWVIDLSAGTQPDHLPHDDLRRSVSGR